MPKGVYDRSKGKKSKNGTTKKTADKVVKVHKKTQMKKAKVVKAKMAKKVKAVVLPAASLSVMERFHIVGANLTTLSSCRAGIDEVESISKEVRTSFDQEIHEHLTLMKTLRLSTFGISTLETAEEKAEKPKKEKKEKAKLLSITPTPPQPQQPNHQTPPLPLPPTTPTVS